MLPLWVPGIILLLRICVMLVVMVLFFCLDDMTPEETKARPWQCALACIGVSIGLAYLTLMPFGFWQ